MRRMNILILGCAGHGKDEVADILQKLLGLKKMSSSWYTGKVVLERMREYAKTHNRPDLNYASVEECHANRDKERVLWKQFINEYNTPDLTRLTRELYEIADVYVGLRNEHEFIACCKAGLYDLVIAVDATKRKGIAHKTDLTIPLGVADVWVDNNDGLAELEGTVWRVAEFIKELRILRETMRDELSGELVGALIDKYKLKPPQSEIDIATDWIIEMMGS